MNLLAWIQVLISAESVGVKSIMQIYDNEIQI